MTRWRQSIGVLFVGTCILVVSNQALVLSTESIAWEKQRLLENINAILRDTWIQRWFAAESVPAATVQNERFREVLQDSAAVEAAARSVIADPDVNVEVKKIVIYMMQCLPPSRYIAFVRFVFLEALATRCPRSLVAEALYPGAHWGAGISLGYRAQEVKVLLNEIEEAFLGDSRVNERISSILDGSYAEYIEHLRATGDLVPPVRCVE